MTEVDKIINHIKLCIGDNNGKDIYIHEPYFGKSNAYEYLKECIDSGWVSSSGKWVSKFEHLLAEFTGAKYAIAVSNGTVALRLALFLVGVKQEDEVFVPPLSFVATCNAVSYHKLVNPIFG